MEDLEDLEQFDASFFYLLRIKAKEVSISQMVMISYSVSR